MTEQVPPERGAGIEGDPRSPAHPHGDRDIDLRGVLGFWGGVAVLIVLSALICWAIYGALRRGLVAQDPAPSPLIAARVPEIPPGPRLQRNPAADMAELRERELHILGSYGWVDRERGIARIPLDLAMKLRVSRGLTPALAEPEVKPGRDGGAP